MLMKALLVQDMVFFPHMSVEFSLNDEINFKTARAAFKKNTDSKIVLVYDKVKEPDENGDTYGKIGVVCNLLQVREVHGENIILVVCEKRCFINKLVVDENIRLADIDVYTSEVPKDLVGKPVVKAMINSLKRVFRMYSELEKTPEELRDIVKNSNDLAVLVDLLSPLSELSYKNLYDLFANDSILQSAISLTGAIKHQIELLKIEREIDERAHYEMSQDQRDYFLRSQMAAISEELYGTAEDECDKFMAQIEDSLMPDEHKEKLFDELRRLRLAPSSSPEANTIRTYLEYCLKLPWGKIKPSKISLPRARKILDADHYGLTEVKERIIEMIAAMALSDKIKGQILCFVGPPGVGKTSIVRSIAVATGREYQRIALGGVRDEAEIRGHRRTYIGAVPGRIINAVIDAKTSNPLILFDEIDKIANDYRGDPAAALLEVLDPEQNSHFVDHYIDLQFDLSKVLFVATANDASSIPPALLDRMDIIELGSYTAEEKFQIAKRHLIPKQMKEHNITKEQFRLPAKVIRTIIEEYTREAGVRKLERIIAKLCRKVAVSIVESGEKVEFTVDTLHQYLGAPKFKNTEKLLDEVGLVNGLAWTAVGGELLQVETAIMDGKSSLEMTGMLGDVMKESAVAAISYVRSRAKELNIDPEFAKKSDIHIHVPEGAVPKDGPSAGVTIATSLVSALTGRKARGDIAMTGEVTLRGRVLPIGGLREKSMAAYKNGIKTVIIPEMNMADLDKVDETVKKKVNFIPVKNVDEVLKIALI